MFSCQFVRWVYNINPYVWFKGCFDAVYIKSGLDTIQTTKSNLFWSNFVSSRSSVKTPIKIYWIGNDWSRQPRFCLHYNCLVHPNLSIVLKLFLHVTTVEFSGLCFCFCDSKQTTYWQSYENLFFLQDSLSNKTLLRTLELIRLLDAPKSLCRIYFTFSYWRSCSIAKIKKRGRALFYTCFYIFTVVCISFFLG